MDKILWRDRKRWICGLPWTFTKYTLTSKTFVVETGLLTSKEFDVRLYRIVNVSTSRTLIQKIFKVGNVHIDSSDKDLEHFDLVNIKNPQKVARFISEQVEGERLRNRVTAREYMMDHDDEDHEEFNY